MSAMLTMTFADAGAEQRQRFATAMDEADWVRVPDSETAWAASFPNADIKDGNAHRAICEHTVHTVHQAARAAGIARFSAAVHVGIEIPTLFSSP